MAAADIANLSLGRLRHGQAIADIDDTGSVATICRRFYDQCRQEVLRAFPWPFAQRAVALAEVADQTFPGWTYVYQYPSECIKVNAVMDEGGIRYASRLLGCDVNGFNQIVKRMPFQIALKDDEASGIILSDVTDAWAFHTVDVENTGIFPSDFTSAFAWRLAMEVGGPLQVDSAAIDRAEIRYTYAISNAAAQARNEEKDDPEPDSPSIACR